MVRSIVGRCDLVEALRRGEDALLNATARLLSLEAIDLPQDTPITTPSEDESGSPDRRPLPEPDEARGWTRFEPAASRYWQLVDYAAIEIESEPEPRPSGRKPGDPAWRNPPLGEPPVCEPLATKRELLTRLRKATGYRCIGHRPDIPEIVNRISECEVLNRVPLKPVRVWGSSLHVIQDRSKRLTPYWSDQDFVCRILKAIYPRYSLTISRLWGLESTPQVLWPPERRGHWQHPHENTAILVLGDLASLATDAEEREAGTQNWLNLARFAARTGNQRMALIPCRSDEVTPAVSSLWNTIPWEAARSAADSEALQKLLTLVSPSVRLEPGLLREIRRQFLADGRGNPGLESRLWQHDAISSRHSVAASFDADWLGRLRQAFELLPDVTRQEVLTLIREWRGRLHEAIWFEEIIGMDDDARQWFAGDVADAIHMLNQMSEQAWEGPGGVSDWPTFVTWARGTLKRLPADTWRRAGIGEAIHSIHEAVKSDFDPTVSDGFQPARVKAAGSSGTTLVVSQHGSSFCLASQDLPGNPVGTIRTRNGHLKFSEEPIEQNDSHRPPKPKPQAPEWAAEGDEDEIGWWCTIRVGQATQKLRWIPAGRFLMGSGEDETDAFDDERPQHEVTISTGFWMFDTPCTQVFWKAVMGNSPSSFKGDQRPVESVSWDDCQQFISKLNTRYPGLTLRLPTEAEWEYACRAGNKEQRYGELDEIAWYSGNSKNETHAVARKQPNDFGLYDMLGNVLEWSREHWTDRYEQEAVTDPLRETTDDRAGRVVRGGSWDDSAQGVRAAYRNASHPEGRYVNLGFRCLSSSPLVRQASEAAASDSVSSVGGAARSRSELPPRGTIFEKPIEKEWKSETDSIVVPCPRTDTLTVESDVERITFRMNETPPWAAESGHDQYGLWANLQVDSASQRFRWVPPGRFLMGSPVDDSEALDREQPQHEVTISTGFWMFDTPCTQALWHAVTKEKPSHFEGEDRPVEQVSWDDCVEFCKRLNRRISHLELRLPTEAEWEYACRAGTEQPRYAAVDQVAWFSDNSSRETHPVGEKQPNELGLYDMLGNVWEWCEDDWFREYTTAGAVDPMFATKKTNHERALRVVRGGSWSNSAQFVRAAFRLAFLPGDRYVSLGFRCLSSPRQARERGGKER